MLFPLEKIDTERADVCQHKALVVAHYNEDVSWIPTTMPVYLYAKGDFPLIKRNVILRALPNIGRESHTYLSHIIRNYDKLEDITIFSQGDPFPHSTNFVNVIEKNTLREIAEENEKEYPKTEHPTPDVEGFAVIGQAYYCYRDDDNPWEQLWAQGGPLDFMWEWLGYKLPIQYPLLAFFGAHFAISKEVIRKRPKKNYEELLLAHHDHYALAWALEVFWHLVFNTNLKHEQTACSKIHFGD